MRSNPPIHRIKRKVEEGETEVRTLGNLGSVVPEPHFKGSDKGPNSNSRTAWDPYSYLLSREAIGSVCCCKDRMTTLQTYVLEMSSLIQEPRFKNPTNILKGINGMGNSEPRNSFGNHIRKFSLSLNPKLNY